MLGHLNRTPLLVPFAWFLGVLIEYVVPALYATFAREESRTVRLNPGRLHITVASTGRVGKVDAGPASELGIQPGWYIHVIDGAPFTPSLLKSKSAGTHSYIIVLRRQVSHVHRFCLTLRLAYLWLEVAIGSVAHHDDLIVYRIVRLVVVLSMQCFSDELFRKFDSELGILLCVERPMHELMHMTALIFMLLLLEEWTYLPGGCACLVVQFICPLGMACYISLIDIHHCFFSFRHVCASLKLYLIICLNGMLLETSIDYVFGLSKDSLWQQIETGRPYVSSWRSRSKTLTFLALAYIVQRAYAQWKDHIGLCLDPMLLLSAMLNMPRKGKLYFLPMFHCYLGWLVYQFEGVPLGANTQVKLYGLVLMAYCFFEWNVALCLADYPCYFEAIALVFLWLMHPHYRGMCRLLSLGERSTTWTLSQSRKRKSSASSDDRSVKIARTMTFPSYWSNLHDQLDQGWRAEKVSPQERKALTKCLITTESFRGADSRGASHSSLEFQNAWRIQHPNCWFMYQCSLNKVRSEIHDIQKAGHRFSRLVVRGDLERATDSLPCKVDRSVNETYLLHGTNPATILKILQAGMNERYSGANAGTVFGHGSYFGDDPAKADAYAKDADSQFDQDNELHKRLFRDCRHPDTDIFYMLLCRVGMGFFAATTNGKVHTGGLAKGMALFAGADRKELSDIPRTQPPLVYHGLVVNTGPNHTRFTEYVQFHSDRIYPEYLIAYSRK